MKAISIYAHEPPAGEIDSHSIVSPDGKDYWLCLGKEVRVTVSDLKTARTVSEAIGKIISEMIHDGMNGEDA